MIKLSHKPANGDYRKEHRERSRSPIERAAAPTVSLHANHMYTSIPSLSMEQPLALTKNSLDARVPALVSPQNRPSVITCASANNRNCNLSHCPIAHSACSGAAYRRPSSCNPVASTKHLKSKERKTYNLYETSPSKAQFALKIFSLFQKVAVQLQSSSNSANHT
uniref:Vestigial like family member 4 n=1 Tax=Junco hyemalis TaxID=40217 RepID=A0A8C5IMB8_JUNHY